MAAESFAWAWNQLYLDPVGYSVVIPAGFNNVLMIAKGAYPPGYLVANGQKGGGYPPSGATSDGTLPIRLQPPPRGSGRLKFVTTATVYVTNNAEDVAEFAIGLGVAYPSEFNKPMWPYLGVAHDNDINELPPETLLRGRTRAMTVNRLDILDNAFIQDQPVADWPEWEMTPCPDNLLYPAVCISFKNCGSVPLTVANVFAFGFVC
jgi:hypothetical protein